MEIVGAHWPASTVNMVGSWFSERLCCKRGEQLRKASEEVDLWPPHVHSIGEQLPPHEHTCIQNTHTQFFKEFLRISVIIGITVKRTTMWRFARKIS